MWRFADPDTVRKTTFGRKYFKFSRLMTACEHLKSFAKANFPRLTNTKK